MWRAKESHLTMKGQAGASGGAPASGERNKPAWATQAAVIIKMQVRKKRPNNPFAAKLMEIEEKFND